MQQPIDRRADLFVERVQPHLCLVIENAMQDGRRRFEVAVGFTVVSVLWALVLLGFIQAL